MGSYLTWLPKAAFLRKTASTVQTQLAQHCMTSQTTSESLVGQCTHQVTACLDKDMQPTQMCSSY